MVTKSYRDAYRRSLEQPAEFWLEAAQRVSWSTPPQAGPRLQPGAALCWFPDGVLNTSYNALDRHVAAGQGCTGRVDIRLRHARRAAKDTAMPNSRSLWPGLPVFCAAAASARGTVW